MNALVLAALLFVWAPAPFSAPTAPAATVLAPDVPAAGVPAVPAAEAELPPREFALRAHPTIPSGRSPRYRTAGVTSLGGSSTPAPSAPTASVPDSPDAGEATASDPVRSSAAHPSQAGAWAPPSNGAEGGTPLGGSTSPAASASWPKVRGPFSWADRVMNSTTIARSGGLYQLRAKTIALYTPTFDVDQHFGPFLTVPQDFDSQSSAALANQPLAEPLPLDFFSYALGSKLYEDAAALLFTPGVFAPSDTLQFIRGVLSYDIHDFSLAADCFASIPEGSPYAIKAKSFLDVWNSTPEIPGYKSKSPLLAGVMSAVLPGSGKIYAGDLRSGVSTLLVVGALGGMAAESWIKLGGNDWRTIALSSVFGLFYIGNIYGSALSVSVIRNTYQDAEKATLLFDLRIPLHQF